MSDSHRKKDKKGKNEIKGTSGDDVLQGSDDKEKFEAKGGNDTVYGAGGDDEIKGGSGDDILFGGEGKDKIEGEDGNDQINGGSGDDDLKGGDGDDQIDGGDGKDKIKGDKGNDILSGGLGDDDLKGGDDDDQIIGGDGEDKIKGDKGNDTLAGGSGNDDVDGGSGNDLAIYNVSDNIGNRDKYNGGSDTDTLLLELTREEWMRDDIQQDIADYLLFLTGGSNGNSKGKHKKADSKKFDFKSFDLEAQHFENFRVTVDGVELDPKNNSAIAIDDSNTTAGEHEPVSGNVLVNDDIPDLVRSVDLVQGTTNGSLIFTEHSALDSFDTTAGDYSYDPGQDFDYLAAGETADDTFTYRVSDSDHDSDTATVTITVSGENDAPNISSGDTDASVSEENDNSSLENNTIHSRNGSISFNDVDLSDSHIVSVSGSGRGSLTAIVTEAANANNGSLDWTYTIADTDIDDLAAGQTLMENFSLTVGDGNGGSAQENITITLVGHNDGPIISGGDTSTSISEESDNSSLENNTLHSRNGSIRFEDVDLTDSHTLRISGSGRGSLTAIITEAANTDNGSVNWTYTIADADIDDLAVGETLTEIFNITVDDGNGGSAEETVTVTVTGSNDAPVANEDTAEISENQSVSIDALANDTDADLSDTYALVTASVSSGLGVANIVSGKLFWSPTVAAADTSDASNNAQSITAGVAEVAPSAYDYLAEGESATVVVDYTVADNNGAESNSIATITVHGKNDAPQVAPAITQNFSEQDEAFTVDLLSGASDVDSGSVLNAANFSEAEGKGGWVLNGNELSIDPNYFDDLNNDETDSLAFTYQIVDEYGASVEQSVSYTVEGFTDAPSLAVSTEAGSKVNHVRLNITSQPANNERVALSFANIPAGAMILDAQSKNVSAGIANFSGSHALTLVLPEGETVDSDLEITVNGINNSGEIIGTNSDTVDLALVIGTDNDELNFSSVKQSMWESNSPAVIGWHEYVPIIGGVSQVWNSQTEEWDATDVPPWSSGQFSLVSIDVDSASIYELAIAGPREILNAARAEFETASIAVDLGAQQVYQDAQAAFDLAGVEAQQILNSAFGTAQSVFDDAVTTGDAAAKLIFGEAERALEDALKPDADAFAKLDSQRSYWQSKADQAPDIIIYPPDPWASQRGLNPFLPPAPLPYNPKKDFQASADAAQLKIDQLPPAGDLEAKRIFDEAQDTFDTVVAAGDSAAKTVWNAAQDAFDVAVDGVDAVAKGILDAAQWAYDHRAFGLDPGNILLNALNGAKAAFRDANAAVVSAAQDILDTARGVFEDAQQLVVNTAQNALDTARGIYDQAQALFLELAETAFNQAKSDYDSAQAVVVSLAQEVLDNAKQAAIDVKDGAIALAQQVLDGAKSVYDTVKQGIYDAAQGVFTLAENEFSRHAAVLDNMDINAEVEVQADIYGEVGLQIDFELDLGSVDTDIEYALTTQKQYNHTTDALFLTPQLENLTEGSTVAFSTISPNVKFIATLVYDVGASFDIFVDGHLKAAGTTLFDLSPTTDGINVSTNVSTGGWNTIETPDLEGIQEGKLEIINFDSTEVDEVEVPFIEQLTEDILSVSLKFPTIETDGTATDYDPAFFQEGGFLTLDLSEITNSFMNLVNAKLDFSPEIREAYDLAELAGAQSIDQLLSSVGDALLKSIFDQLDGQSEEMPLFLIDAADESSQSLLHVNAIPDSVIGQTLNDETATFGFYAAYGESDEVVKINIDIDQAVAVIVNKVAEAALAAVTAGGTAPITQAIPDINPLDLEIGIKQLLEIVEVPKATIENITNYINLSAGFEAADIDVYSAWKFSQEFSLSIDDMSYRVTMEDGAEYVFAANDSEGLKIDNASLHDSNGDGIIDYDMDIVPTAMFSNDTEIRLSVGYVIDYLKASFAAGLNIPIGEILNISSLSPIELKMIDLNMGPLLRIQGDLDLVSADIFEHRFALDVGGDSVSSGVSVIDDIIAGTSGDDVIEAGQGNDILSGGAGNDLFVFGDGHGNDTINDFDLNAGDAIDLTAVSSINSFDDVLIAAEDVGGNTEIDLGTGSITLIGISTTSLQIDDFIV